LILAFSPPSPAFDLRKSLSDAVNKVEKTLKNADEKKQDALNTKSKASEAATPGGAASSASAGNLPQAKLPGASSGGGGVFSKGPIDPGNPTNLTNSFKAGDNIYGLLQGKKTWRELYKATGKNELGLLVFFYIDGQKKTNMYVNLRSPQSIDSKYLVLDVAPSPEMMVNYKDPGILFTESRGLRFGPMMFTKELSQLSPGKHTIRFEVKNYGEDLSTGEFQIEGSDFSVYAALHDKIRSEDTGRRTMPAPGMTNKELEKEMTALLKNAGWPEVVRIVIKDKDWWLDRASGGNSPIVSRHIDAAAAARDNDGSYYYRIVTFQQMKRIDGSFGKLEISFTGDKVPIPKDNILK